MLANDRDTREPTERSKAKISTKYIERKAWSQCDKFIEVYVSISNPGEITDDQYTMNVLSRSVELEIRDHENVNYCFKLKRLYGQIVPQKYEIKRKKDMLVIFLYKQDVGHHWADLQQKTTHEKYNEVKRAEHDEDRSLDDQEAQKSVKNLESPFTLHS